MSNLFAATEGRVTLYRPCTAERATPCWSHPPPLGSLARSFVRTMKEAVVSPYGCGPCGPIADRETHPSGFVPPRPFRAPEKFYHGANPDPNTALSPPREHASHGIEDNNLMRAPSSPQTDCHTLDSDRCPAEWRSSFHAVSSCVRSQRRRGTAWFLTSRVSTLRVLCPPFGEVAAEDCPSVRQWKGDGSLRSKE